MPILPGTRPVKGYRASLALLLALMGLVLIALGFEVQSRGASRREPSNAPARLNQASAEIVGGQRLDLNQASEAELALLPGVGPALASKLVDYRLAHGPFRTLDDAQAIRGIGPKLVDRWRPYAMVSAGESSR